MISKPFYDSLSIKDQKLLRESMKKAEDYQQQLVNDEESKQLAEIEKSGVQVTRLTAAETKSFMVKVEPVKAKYRSDAGADIYDAWIKAVEEASK